LTTVQELKIDDVRSGLAPEDKLDAVRSLRSDAPAGSPGTKAMLLLLPLALGQPLSSASAEELEAVRSLYSDAPPGSPGAREQVPPSPLAVVNS